VHNHDDHVADVVVEVIEQIHPHVKEADAPIAPDLIPISCHGDDNVQVADSAGHAHDSTADNADANPIKMNTPRTPSRKLTKRGKFYRYARGVLNAVHVSRTMNREAERMITFLDKKYMTFRNAEAERDFTDVLLHRAADRLKLMVLVLIFTTVVFVVQDYFSSPANFFSTLVPIRFYVIVPALVMCEFVVLIFHRLPFLMEVNPFFSFLSFLCFRHFIDSVFG
jgi:hypothetical protein